MKKLLLFILLTSIPIIASSQKPQKIIGATVINKGTSYYYTLYFDKITTENTSITFSCTYGKFDNNSSTITKIIPSNSLFFQFLVTWNNHEFSGASIRAYLTNDYSSVKELTGIKTTSNSSNIDVNSISFTGPDLLLSNNTAMYSFHIPKPYPVKWSFDSNYLEEISYIGEHDYRSISLKAKNISTAIKTKISVTSVNGQTREKSITIIPSNNIILGNDYICPYERQTYSIKDLPPGGASVISWSHGLSSTTGPTPVLVKNGNSCYIENKWNYPITLVLKATIQYVNGVQYSVSKTIYSISSYTSFIPKGTTYNMIGGNTIQNQPMFFNGSANIFFNNLNGRKVWWDSNSVQPTSWSFDPYRNLLSVSFKPNHSGPFCFKIGYNVANCEAFYTMTLFNSVSTTKSVNTIESEFNSLSITIYNLTGHIVYEQKGGINFNINNTNLDNGIYIIETIDKVGNVNREKVLKKNKY